MGGGDREGEAMGVVGLTRTALAVSCPSPEMQRGGAREMVGQQSRVRHSACIRSTSQRMEGTSDESPSPFLALRGAGRAAGVNYSLIT